ncbi:MAG: hypothetical protein GY936_05365 [Ignavibacteriae bacterium]|nr:hypothetical protein [Ignavibacteriota bacterium]
MKRIFLITVFMLGFQALLFSQVRDYELGSQFTGKMQNRYGGFYDYSDPGSFNISISVWGFVKYPGRYVVPEYTTVVDLLSYVGGPTDDSNLDELRIYRIDDNNKEQMIAFDFNDLMWADGLDSKYRDVPALRPSDIFVVPGEPRMYFLDYLSLTFGVISALNLLAVLYITVIK